MRKKKQKPVAKMSPRELAERMCKTLPKKDRAYIMMINRDFFDTVRGRELIAEVRESREKINRQERREH